MSKSRLIFIILAIFTLVGAVPLVLGDSVQKATLVEENITITPDLATKEAKLLMSPTLDVESYYDAYLYDVTAQTIDTVDYTGYTSVVLEDSDANDLGWFWIKAPNSTQEEEIYDTLLLSRQLHDPVTVYTDCEGYIYRVTY